MNVDKVENFTCMAKVCHEEGNVVSFPDCGQPSVVMFTTWAGRTESLCWEHAFGFSEHLSAILKETYKSP